MATEHEGDQLICATDVITDIYSPDDWIYVVANEDDLPDRVKWRYVLVGVYQGETL